MGFELSQEARALEVALFLSDEPRSEEELSRITGLSPESVREALEELSSHYLNHGLELRRGPRGFALYSRECFCEVATRALKEGVKRVSLGRAALEVLAIIAYRQPITKGEIEEIRGVRCDKALDKLLSLGLVRAAGRKKSLGAPMLYRTTDRFLELLGLSSLEELPSEEELRSEGLWSEESGRL